MIVFFKRLRREDQGVLTFEWILLLTLIVIGIVGGVSAVRDALISELGDVVGAVVSVDQSYTVKAGEAGGCAAGANEFGFADSLPTCYGQPGHGAERPKYPVVSQGPVTSCVP